MADARHHWITALGHVYWDAARAPRTLRFTDALGASWFATMLVQLEEGDQIEELRQEGALFVLVLTWDIPLPEIEGILGSLTEAAARELRARFGK